ncbi:class V lanthionine synthetase subunit LxmK [Nocardia mexicana]|uniref:Phosphotransferase family enzyme n=1 Tax=Nocardia mexicana TaxID=279262 RepID=A0A370GJP5_9NOCA|nr:class V lanthionine synthetase subunit LxmK [Nocardia mexicana]RDI43479.1 phosphotransferase family enzyme [Nocardia mexicana]
MALRQLDRQPGYAPVDMNRVPRLGQLLERIGTGPFEPDSVTAPVGRNDAWAGKTISGTKVFVKQLVGPERDVQQRMTRILSFEEFSMRKGEAVTPSPRLLGTDADAGLIAFELIDDSRSGSDLMRDEEFTVALATEVGRLIGLLHAAEVPADLAIDRSAPKLPPVDLLQGIPLEMFDKASAGVLETWRILQHDAELIDGVRRLRGWEADAPAVAAHCDFRLDQLLITDDGALYLTDWEEFRITDAARDVGAFAGEWLYRSVLDIVTTRGDAGFAEFELTHELVLQRGAEKMTRLLPLIEAFWTAYRRVRPVLDDQFTVRATAFAGWHLLDRLLAGAEDAARLSGISRAAAGVGRGALLAPDKFAAAIGFSFEEVQ